MIPEKKLKISLQELSLRGYQILALQSEISYPQALQQVQRLKQITKVNQSSKRTGQIAKFFYCQKQLIGNQCTYLR